MITVLAIIVIREGEWNDKDSDGSAGKKCKSLSYYRYLLLANGREDRMG